MSDHLMKYDDFQKTHEAAYAAFRAVFVTQNPQPEEPRAEWDSAIVPISLIAMIVASVIVSGSRTIVEFGGGLIGASAFVMLDLAIIAFSFFRTRRDTGTSDERIQKVRKLATYGLVLAFVVAVSANIHSVLKEKNIGVDERINTIILVLVAISAPTMAFISGDVMALEMMANNAKKRTARERYEAELREWQDKLNQNWNTQKSRWGVKVEVLSTVQPVDGRTDMDKALPSAVRPVDMDTDGHGHGTGQGYSKRTDARTLIWTHLDTFPSDAQLTVRELAEKVGAGKSTVAEVLREYRANHRGE